MKQQTLPGLSISSLEEKIRRAEEVIIKAYEENDGKLFISFSGGKDSTILRAIALRLYPDLPVVFSNTTNELAEVLKFVKTIPNVITVTPKLTFTEVVEKYGFPLVSKEVSQKVNELKRTHGKKTRIKRAFGDNKGNGKLPDKWQFLAEADFDVTHKCCSILKKDPLEKWASEKGLKPIIALMGDESNLREQLKLYGEDNGNKIYPFLKTGWEEEDIWAAASLMGIRFAECYYDKIITLDGLPTFVKARKRTGCEYCGFGVTLEKEDRFERSMKISPKRYKKMMEIKNNGVTFKEALSLVKRKTLPSPTGIPGTTIFKKSNYISDNKQPTTMIHTVSTTIVKKCPRCESKNLSRNFKHYGNFPDSPLPDGTHRRIFVESKYGYDCLECGSVITDDLHLFDIKLGVTKRLVKYIEKRLSKRSFADIVDETGIDFDLAYDIVKMILERRKCQVA